MGYAKGLVLKETAIPTICRTVTTDASSGKKTVTPTPQPVPVLVVSQLPVQRASASGPQLEKLSLMVYSILIKC